jgi:curli biogenesis system outer membrane secretion channel CsgG
MKRLLVVALPAALALLTGCGGTACTSTPAPLAQSSNTSCTLAAGSTATIDVTLCGKCTDSGWSCQAEFVNNQLEVAPTAQQCQESAGCGVAASCAVTQPHATCTVTIPATASGTVPIVIIGDSQVNGQLTIGQGTSCSLL